jgi:hypothetical protein
VPRVAPQRERSMSSSDDPPQRDRWARLRFAIIGPLLAAPPADGDLHEALNDLAAKTWRHPFTGLEVRFGCSTLERWYYTAKRAGDPMLALRNQVRRDIGRFPSFSAAAVEALTAQYREHPGWTAQLHHDNLRVTPGAVVGDTKCPSYPSVRRSLKAQGLLRRRTPRRATDGALAARDRLEQREIRSYEVEHVLQLLRMRSSVICGLQNGGDGKSASPAQFNSAYLCAPEHRNQLVWSLETSGPKRKRNDGRQRLELFRWVNTQVNLRRLNISVAQP